MPVVLPVTMITLSLRRIALRLRLQDGFDDPPGVHCLKRFFPLTDGPDAAGDRADVEAAGCDQPDDAFPDWPVVTEAALKRDVLLHESIEREFQRLRTPADFADPSARPNEVESCRKRRGDAGR